MFVRSPLGNMMCSETQEKHKTKCEKVTLILPAKEGRPVEPVTVQFMSCAFQNHKPDQCVLKTQALPNNDNKAFSPL